MSGDNDPIPSAIADSINLEGDYRPAVISYLVMAEWIDRDGERQFFTDVMEDQRRGATLGLLEVRRALEWGRIQRADAEER